MLVLEKGPRLILRSDKNCHDSFSRFELGIRDENPCHVLTDQREFRVRERIRYLMGDPSRRL